MIKYAKTFSAVVDKLEVCGWTLLSELGIYAVNVIGRTDGIIDIDKLLLWYFRENEYEHLKNCLIVYWKLLLEMAKKVIDVIFCL